METYYRIVKDGTFTLDGDYTTHDDAMYALDTWQDREPSFELSVQKVTTTQAERVAHWDEIRRTSKQANQLPEEYLKRKEHRERNMRNEILTTKELSEKVKVNPRTIDRWKREGFIPFIQVQRYIRYDWADVKRAFDDLQNLKKMSRSVNRRTALKAFCDAIDPKNQPQEKH